ncbi:unnamed protein product [Trichobilharzia regenti]|nr:unnamed protein product [Trichobilharzia regenti]
MAAPTQAERDEWIRMLERVTHRLAERRGTRSISVDCTSSSSSTTAAAVGGGGCGPGSSSMTIGRKPGGGVGGGSHLPPPVSSVSLRRNGAGSQPDLPSQQSVLN